MSLSTDLLASMDSSISPFISAVIVLLATYIAARLARHLLDRYFTRLAGNTVTETSYRLIRRLMVGGIYIVGIAVAVYMLPGLRQLSLALLASAGFFGIVLGLAAQSAFSNVISGVFLAVFQPFRIGDLVETQQHYGWVEDITLRHTVIKTPANERVVVPNATISDEYIINYSIRESKCRYDVQAGIAYGSNIDTARQIMLDAADEHENTHTGESEVIVKDLQDSSVQLELRIWGDDRLQAWRAGQDVRETIKKRFDAAEGVTIPFPQRTISYLHENREE